jgi:hypothetical protein
MHAVLLIFLRILQLQFLPQISCFNGSARMLSRSTLFVKRARVRSQVPRLPHWNAFITIAQECDRPSASTTFREE